MRGDRRADTHAPSRRDPRLPGRRRGQRGFPGRREALDAEVSMSGWVTGPQQGEEMSLLTPQDPASIGSVIACLVCPRLEAPL